MRNAKILFRDQECGVLIQHDDGTFTFSYHDLWFNDRSKPGISLSLTKAQQVYHSEFLFPFFFNKLPEGTNKQVVCRLNRIDETDYFGLLLISAKYDSIGAVRLIKADE